MHNYYYDTLRCCVYVHVAYVLLNVNGKRCSEMHIVLFRKYILGMKFGSEIGRGKRKIQSSLCSISFVQKVRFAFARTAKWRILFRSRKLINSIYRIVIVIVDCYRWWFSLWYWIIIDSFRFVNWISVAFVSSSVTAKLLSELFPAKVIRSDSTS